VAVTSAGPYAICTSLRTDNHASTSSLSFLQARCPSCYPTNSVTALKANQSTEGNKQQLNNYSSKSIKTCATFIPEQVQEERWWEPALELDIKTELVMIIVIALLFQEHLARLNVWPANVIVRSLDL